MRSAWGVLRAGLVLASVAVCCFSQQTYTWQQLKEKFEATNPTLKAGQDNIAESRAEEITAYLRPNPDFSLTADGLQISRNQGVWRPFAGVFEVPGVSYLHERAHKRELRLQSAQQTTSVTISQYDDERRGLIFNLRNAFVQVLQAKAVLQNATSNLKYWDHELQINKNRWTAGDEAEVDYDRLLLQRVQFESDYETALANLRTAKITLLQMMMERTPLENFDVSGSFDFGENLKGLQEYRSAALAKRPDLRAAVQSVALARTNYDLAVANGSTDPTFSIWFTHNASIANPFANNTVGGSISIPLRIFDRNQGEKARTLIDIRRNERLRDAAQAQVFSDVDSAYVTLESTVNLLRPYREKYLGVAAAVRDKVTFAYQHGGASLLDYLDAEKAFRDTQLAYINLVGSYMVAAAQLNEAVGEEILE